MKKVVGYVIAVVGIVVMAFGFGIVPLELAILENIASIYVSGVGIVLIILGAFMALKGGSPAQKQEEVPIYEGDKIVGYRKG